MLRSEGSRLEPPRAIIAAIEKSVPPPLEFARFAAAQWLGVPIIILLLLLLFKCFLCTFRLWSIFIRNDFKNPFWLWFSILENYYNFLSFITSFYFIFCTVIALLLTFSQIFYPLWFLLYTPKIYFLGPSKKYANFIFFANFRIE